MENESERRKEKRDTERERSHRPTAGLFNRVGMAFRWSGLRADGLKTHFGSHINK